MTSSVFTTSEQEQGFDSRSPGSNRFPRSLTFLPINNNNNNNNNNINNNNSNNSYSSSSDKDSDALLVVVLWDSFSNLQLVLLFDINVIRTAA